MMIAKVVEYNPDQWWCIFYNCSFRLLQIRQHTVLVKSGSDEGYRYPNNVHEFPISAVEIKTLEE